MMNALPTLNQDKMAERLAQSEQTAGAFCESSLLTKETYGNRSPKSTPCRLTYCGSGNELCCSQFIQVLQFASNSRETFCKT